MFECCFAEDSARGCPLLATSLHAASWPETESLLTALVNEIDSSARPGVLVLDDYHVIDTPTVHSALAFLIDHLPAQLHLVIAGRTDPPLSLARLRARDQLIELRAADLSFTPIESTAFLNEIMRLNLTQADIAALAERTEGWIAGLQMAALSLQGREDRSEFVRAFTGSHRFLLDYLIEEVLDRQTRRAQPPGSGESRAKWVCCSRFPCSSSSLGSNKYPR